MLHRQDLATIPAQLHRKRLWSSSPFLVFMCRDRHVWFLLPGAHFICPQREKSPSGIFIDRREKWLILRAFFASPVGCSFCEEKLFYEVS